MYTFGLMQLCIVRAPIASSCKLKSKKKKLIYQKANLTREQTASHPFLSVSYFSSDRAWTALFFASRIGLSRGSILACPLRTESSILIGVFLLFSPARCICVSICGLRLSLRLNVLGQNGQAVICGGGSTQGIPRSLSVLRCVVVSLCRVRCSWRSNPLSQGKHT